MGVILVISAVTLHFLRQKWSEEAEWQAKTLEMARSTGAVSPQKEYTVPTDLHSESGILSLGWARRPLFLLNWTRVDVDRRRRKVWEHYTFFTPTLAGHLTVTDLGTVTLAAVEIFDLLRKEEMVMRMEVLPPATIDFPLDASSDLEFRKGSCFLSMTKIKRSRRVTFSFPHDSSCFSPSPSSTLSGDITFNEVSEEALAVIVPFKENDLFFYEYKMPALAIERGRISFPGFHADFGKKLIQREGEEESGDGSGYGVLDWGRGAWPLNNHWLWGSGTLSLSLSLSLFHNLCLSFSLV